MWCLCWCEDSGGFGSEMILPTCWAHGVGEQFFAASHVPGDAPEGAVCWRVSALGPWVPQV